MNTPRSSGNASLYSETPPERFNSSPANVKEHATLSAGASVDHGGEVGITEEHVNRAADRGCCVSTCYASSFCDAEASSMDELKKSAHICSLK